MSEGQTDVPQLAGGCGLIPAKVETKSHVHGGPLPSVELGRIGQEHPREAQNLEGSPQAEPDLVWSTGSVMVKSPLNRELVATYEVTLSVIDNASDLPERSVSVPNGKIPTKASPIGYSELVRAGGQARNRNRHRPGPREEGHRRWQLQ